MAAASLSLLATSLPLLLLLLGSCSGADPIPKDATDAKVNDLADDILHGITTYVTDNNLTTINLPDVQQSFSFTLLWILSLSGTVNLTLGTVTDFSRVERDGDADILFIKDARQLVVRMGIKVSRVHAHYTFNAKTGVVKQHGEVDATVTGTKASLMLSMFTDTLKPSLVELHVEDLGKINVGIKDGIFGWVASGVANAVVGSMRRTIKDAVEKQLPPIINSLLDQLDIPAMIRPPKSLQGSL